MRARDYVSSVVCLEILHIRQTSKWQTRHKVSASMPTPLLIFCVLPDWCSNILRERGAHTAEVVQHLGAGSCTVVVAVLVRWRARTVAGWAGLVVPRQPAFDARVLLRPHHVVSKKYQYAVLHLGFGPGPVPEPSAELAACRVFRVTGVCMVQDTANRKPCERIRTGQNILGSSLRLMSHRLAQSPAR